MKTLLPTLLLLLWPLAGHSDETVISDAGREVSINADGSWHFTSEDRYATNSDGERIRLKPDGHWEILSGEALATTQHSAVFRDAPEYKAVEFMLDKVVIESFRSKATINSKNTHLSTQTIFYLRLSVPSTEQQDLNLEASTSKFSVFDSTGDDYSIISIKPHSIRLAPGEELVLEIRADGAPAWKYGKSYELNIAADVANTETDLVLTMPLSETRKVDVDGFDN